MAVQTVKNKVPVIILTTSYRLEGEMHVVPGGRLLDEINRERDFIPLTNATLFDPASGQPVDTLEFIAINKQLILMIAPAEGPEGN